MLHEIQIALLCVLVFMRPFKTFSKMAPQNNAKAFNKMTDGQGFIR